MESRIGGIKILIKLIFVIILILVVVVLYYLFLQPALSHNVFTTKSIHQGEKYYRSGEYLDFESGTEFEHLLCTTQYLSRGEIIDFYHVDNHLRDNPFWGKMCDVFSVDIQATETLLSNISLDENDYCGEMGDYNLYQLPQCEYSSNKNIALIGLCDKQNLIRIVLITDIEQYEFKSGYKTVLLNQSSLEWD